MQTPSGRPAPVLCARLMNNLTVREPRNVVQKIRPVLETHCRNLGGGIILEGDMLGPIIGKIRDAGAGHQLYTMLDGLEQLNEYTNRHHHGTNPQAAVEPI